MLSKIELKCFRTHEHLTVNFEEGLNVIRAPNEGGKTSLLEAINYALFGAAGLRNSLDDVVTWGHKPSELKVIAQWGDYTITRSKSGAEVTCMGQVFATGQGEVSRFCETLVGAKAKLAESLMFSSQMGLRGILTGGPTATAGLIEELGEFDLFDRILDAAEHKLTLGSASALESRLNSLRSQAASMPKDVESPDEEAFQVKIAELENGIQENNTRHDAQRKALKSLREELTEAQTLKQNLISALGEKGRVSDQVRSTQEDMDAALNAAQDVYQDTSIIEKAIHDAEHQDKRLKAWTLFESLPTVEHQDREAFETRYKFIAERIKGLEATAHAAAKDEAVAKAKLTTSSVCDICGQDVSQFSEVAQRNADLEAIIRNCQYSIAEAEKEWETLVAEKGKANEVINLDVKLAMQVRPCTQYISFDSSAIPAKYTWTDGEVSLSAVDVETLKKNLRKAQASNKIVTDARAKVETLQKVLERLTQQQTQTEKEIEKLQSQYSEERHASAAMGVSNAEAEIADLTAQIHFKNINKVQVTAKFNEAVQAYKNYQEQARNLEIQIKGTEEEIETLQWNNSLVKKIKSARPVVGNRLWEMVLSSVSTIFSAMRGEQSLVTKGKDGFKVNGQSLSSYSGSTIDLLGLAVRSALTKTFISDCQLLILDEPSAACDQDRTNSMLGYVAGCGFKQVLLVTHNDSSESFANNVIRL